ncbi:hypothetical protein BSL78_26916 [Apostichopus japonicus]|uniref:SRCR domain-containing protein n=1 Tax=Stichopus japonicus TaxID=307972 RepID=A0A2G8JKG9_STIJA|nr:hypothetical protein BSL78_26916 [Apostichopus japonicus]
MLLALNIIATLLRYIFLLGIHTGVVEAKDPNIRLAGGDLHRKGRVEVLLYGEWGTICDDDWDYNDAIVFCRQLGFKDVDKVRKNAFFGEGNGQIFMDGIECDGTERAITDCPYISNHNCIHSEDAGVVCTSDFVAVCPSNKTISVTSDVIKARVDWTGPFTGSQDVSTACSHSTGDYYDVGITMVTCSFSSYVHSWTCPFYIAICPTDYFSIKQFCPMNVTKTTDRETNGIQVFWTDFTLDQCRYNTSKSHVPGEAFPLGVTRVTYTYYGNTEYVYRLCTFYVHVIDTIEVNNPESTTRTEGGSTRFLVKPPWFDQHILWIASIILFTTVLLVTIIFITWRRYSLNQEGDQTAEGIYSTIVAYNRQVPATSFQDHRTSFDEVDFMHVPMKASCEAQKPSTFNPIHREELSIYEEPKQCQINTKADACYASKVDFA